MITAQINIFEETLKELHNPYAPKSKRVIIDVENIDATPKVIAQMLRGIADELDSPVVRNNPYSINTVLH
jgi:hypothetical protein